MNYLCLDSNPGSGLNGHHVDGPGLDKAATTERSAELAATANVLSEREKQIIDGVIKGHSNKVMERMRNAESTVKVHMKAILRKVRCSNPRSWRSGR